MAAALGEPKAAMVVAQPEAFWRQAELERRFQSLDQEEHALHQSQMRIFREQMAAFLRDLELVRQELSSMESENAGLLDLVGKTHEAHSMLDRAQHHAAERLACLEKSAQDSAEWSLRQERQFEGLLERCRSTGDRVGTIQAGLSTLEAVTTNLCENMTASRESTKRLEEVQDLAADRLSALERNLQDLSAQQHDLRRKLVETKHAEGLHEDLPAMASRVASLEKLLGKDSAADRISVLDRGLRDLATQQHELRAKYAEIERAEDSAADRLSALERNLRDLATQHHELRVQLVDAKPTEVTHKRLAAVHGRVDAIESTLANIEGRFVQGLHESLPALASRMTGLERALGEELQQIRAAHDRHASGLDDLRALQTRSADEMGALRRRSEGAQAATEHRLYLVETLLGSAGGERAKLEQAAGDPGEAQPLADVQERMDRLEKLVRRSLQELEALRASPADLPDRVGARECGSGEPQVLREVHERRTAGAQAAELQHAAVVERLGRAEEKLCDAAARFGQDLAGLQAAIRRLEPEVTRFATKEKARTLVQCSLADRVSNLERTIDEKFERIDGRLSVARGIWARDRERLLGAYKQLDHIADGLEKDVRRTASSRVRRRSPPSGSDTPPPRPGRSLSLATLSLCPGSSPRGAGRSLSARAPCDWDEAIKRMHAEGIVHSEEG